jgi:hypothetical protein
MSKKTTLKFVRKDELKVNEECSKRGIRVEQKLGVRGTVTLVWVNGCAYIERGEGSAFDRIVKLCS